MKSKTLDKNPILVTGAHRSGTTWVGRILASAPGVAYIHEPLNLRQRPGRCNAPVNEWYPHITDADTDRFYPPLRAAIEYRYDIRAELAAIASVRDIVRMIRDWTKFSYLRLLVRPRPVIKDPFALFSATWYAKHLNAKVVILVRHPAAYVSSVLKKGWSFPFSHWANQETLLGERLQPFSAEIRQYAAHSPALLDQAILLWRATHYIVHKYRRQHPAWIIARHEDLSRDPSSEFSKIFARLELDYTARVQAFIHSTTRAQNSSVSSGESIFNIHRDSSSNIHYWKTRLEASEIAHIRRATADVAPWFYDESDWL